MIKLSARRESNPLQNNKNSQSFSSFSGVTFGVAAPGGGGVRKNEPLHATIEGTCQAIREKKNNQTNKQPSF
jgi:hypothetical protein